MDWSTLISSGVIAAAITIVGLLIGLGGERRRVLDHVLGRKNEDDVKHLSKEQRELLTTIPYRLDEIKRQQEKQWVALEEVLREVRKAARRADERGGC